MPGDVGAHRDEGEADDYEQARPARSSLESGEKQMSHIRSLIITNSISLLSDASHISERMKSATRSPIIIVGRLMFARGTVGITEASAT